MQATLVFPGPPSVPAATHLEGCGSLMPHSPPFLWRPPVAALSLCSPLTPLLTHQYNYGFVVEKTAAARLPPSVS